MSTDTCWPLSQPSIAQLADGLRHDRDDKIHLTYAPYEPRDQEIQDIDEDEDMDVDEPPITPQKRPSPLPFPLSPVSNPTSSPSRKRQRTAGWQPPEHVPDFLPPFPTAAPPSPVSPPPLPLPEIEEQQQHQMLPPMLPPPLNIKLERPQLPPPLQSSAQQTMTSSAASDYLVQVPYSQSSLSSVPEWHLPPSSALPPSTHQLRNLSQAQSTPQTEHSLLAAYHYILTHPPPLHPLFPGRTTIPPTAAAVPIGPNTLLPSRHKVAMTLLYQTQALSRWEPADSLFGTAAPCSPRVAAIGPTYPVPIDEKEKNAPNKDLKFPPVPARPVGAPERIVPVVSQQGSRIPDLARHVLPVSAHQSFSTASSDFQSQPLIFSRTSRLSHPPILYRGTKALTYGQGIPAPWNSNPDGTSQPPPTPAVTKPSAKDALLNGKEKDKEKLDKEKDKSKDTNGQTKASVALPDAKLYATWDYEPKDCRIPLPTRTRTRMAAAAGSAYSAAASPSASTPAGGGLAAGSVSGLRSRSSSRIV